MNSDFAVLPPLDKVAAALREITEILAHELTVPTDEPPAWSDFEWRIAHAVAAMQGVSSLLSSALHWGGPANWRRFLEEQREHITRRHLRIMGLLDRIDSQARAQGIALVALKGVALHRCGIYQIGERPMADIDLLVRDADVEATARLLEDCGYQDSFTTWRHKLFEARYKPGVAEFGEHFDNPIKIELHTSIRERLPVTETDITHFIFPYTANPGLNDYRSVASLMMHLIFHAAGNIRAHALRLIQLHDIAKLAARFAVSDWEELLNARANNRGLWWAVPPLLMTVRYYPAAIPAFVIARLNKHCPWLLGKFAGRQLLADVSWSNIWVHAFAGIEWSRTPQEALVFIFARIWPDFEARRELQRFASHHPGASKIPWYGISQGARILRWMSSKPPRVQTLLSVRAALAQPYDEAGRGVTQEYVAPGDA